MVRRLIPIALVTLATLALAAGPAAAAKPFPDTITLTSDATATTGFRAEGIASRGTTAYAGSIATGTIVQADLRTGDVTTLVESADGPALGLTLRGDVLYVAGGPSGQLRAYDTDTGELLDQVQLAAPDTAVINDLTISHRAVYVTDSFSATIYRVPLARGGTFGEPEPLTLTGDFVLANGFNGNGIVATGPGRFILAQTSDPIDGVGSALYAVTVHGSEAVADRIELSGDIVGADGLVLRGRTLYVVENEADRVAEIRLSGRLGSGTVVATHTDDDAHTPTTATHALGALYAVNARFADIDAGADPATLDYDIIRIDVR
jgi:hypothetical protein